MTDASPRRSPLREFGGGVQLLFRGLGVWATAPSLMALGMIPPIIVGAAVIAGLVALGVNLEVIAEWVTPFAAGWDEPFRTVTRIVAGLATLGVAILLIVYLFTTLTLMIGQPFYERIWSLVERRYGEEPTNPVGFWTAFWRSLGAGLRLLVPTILLGAALFLIGFIPIVGQVLVVVLGALVGGWLLVQELTGLAFDARGMTFRQRRQVLRGRRASALGFGAATYLAFLLPLGAVIMMPAAVAGATILARKSLGESITRAGGAPRTAPGPPD